MPKTKQVQTKTPAERVDDSRAILRAAQRAVRAARKAAGLSTGDKARRGKQSVAGRGARRPSAA